MLNSNNEVCRDFLCALGAGDAEGVKRYIAKDIVAVATGTSLVSGTRGYDEIVGLTPFFKEITQGGVMFDFIALTAEDDRVSVEAQGISTMKHGLPYNNQYHFLFTLREGKIVRMKEYFDGKLVENCFAPYLTNRNPLNQA